MATVPRQQYLVDVEPWLLAANDDAPAPGRLTVHAGCGACGQRRRLVLPAGRWQVDHDHGAGWTAHLVRLSRPGNPLPVPPRRSPVPAPKVAEVAALASAFADALTH